MFPSLSRPRIPMPIPIPIPIPVSRLSSRRREAGTSNDSWIGLLVFSFLFLLLLDLHNTNPSSDCPGCDNDRYYVAHCYHFLFLSNRLPDCVDTSRWPSVYLRDSTQFIIWHHACDSEPKSRRSYACLCTSEPDVVIL